MTATFKHVLQSYLHCELWGQLSKTILASVSAHGGCSMNTVWANE